MCGCLAEPSPSGVSGRTLSPDVCIWVASGVRRSSHGVSPAVWVWPAECFPTDPPPQAQADWSPASEIPQLLAVEPSSADTCQVTATSRPVRSFFKALVAA